MESVFQECNKRLLKFNYFENFILNILRDIKHKENNLFEKYNNLKKLSNEEVIKKIENSIEVPGFDLQKGMFPDVIKRKNENKIDFLFGKRISGMH